MSEALLAPIGVPVALARPAIAADEKIEISDRLRIAPAAPQARFVFRARAEAFLPAQKALGLPLSQKIGEAHSAPPRHVLRLGPDEWLILAPMQEAAQLGHAIGSVQPSSLVDISSRDIVFIVEGVQAEDVLNAGCPLDLDPDTFPIQTCTRTLFARTEILLWRTGRHAFQIATQRSFARYLFGLLQKAAREFERV